MPLGRLQSSLRGRCTRSTYHAPFGARREAGGLVCSAKGCRAVARWALRWNNPSLHDPERRKTWLACDQHRESLSGFLEARGFLREVTPFGAIS